MPEWVTAIEFVVLLITSIIGQGTIGFLLARLVYDKYFKPPDTSEVHIELLEDRLTDLKSQYNSIEDLNKRLMLTMVQAFSAKE